MCVSSQPVPSAKDLQGRRKAEMVRSEIKILKIVWLEATGAPNK
jgi:hypothetical protein